MAATARPRSAAQAPAAPGQPSALARNGMLAPGRGGKGSVPGASRSTDRASAMPGDRSRQAGRRSAVVAAPVDARLLPRPSTRDVSGGRVVKGPVRERHEADAMVILATIGLAAMGVLMSYSTGAAAIGLRPDALQTVLGPEIVWVTMGIAVMAFMSRVDYRLLRLVSVVAFGFVLVLLAILILTPELGPISVRSVGGAARWLVIGGGEGGGGLSVHPAELGKLALVVYLAHWMARRGSSMGSLIHGTIPFLIIAGSVIALVALEPDLGTTGVITLTAFTMFFVAGGSILHLALLLPAGIMGVWLYINTNDYQLLRWQTFFDPWGAGDPGYQTVQGLLSLGMGGMFGTGLGTALVPGGLHLPNADNDFVFAMVGQELGMVGALLVVGLFVVLAWRGITIARRAPDAFGALLAIGVSVCLVFQAFINIGVVVQLLPLTGITLPFLSAGTSSLLVSFAAVGILLSVSRETVREEEQEGRGITDDAHHGRGRGHWRPHLPGARRAPDPGAATTGS
ncbi:MAG: cell division protein FtsW [Chloroflexi bacterium]|nr:cell division protein FtsW [Chloroflexota bacterium]